MFIIMAAIVDWYGQVNTKRNGNKRTLLLTYSYCANQTSRTNAECLIAERMRQMSVLTLNTIDQLSSGNCDIYYLEGPCNN
ncbi:hypothetical protein K2173_015702 [Erythroxylum novogranatense]|uniref:Uncharacterized protein n=1 Tax=Erythroxylum novogranatense TaxID=1862640 RepID=A0AAV8TG21_9ROSI|nr:hypothetical protein K2173_015702 [Erythroxylum novogranatense]